LKLKEKENAINEVRILASVQDKNIISYKEAFYDETSQTLCIIMELASGGDLGGLIKKNIKNKTFVPEETIWNYLIQMIQGLKALHNMKIVHRDLKSANIFLGDEGATIKLGDLNVSKVAKNGLVYTQAGTPYYCAPEIWREEAYNFKCDIWSLGCVLFELCALMPPFRAQDMNGLYKKIQKGAFERIPSNYSNDLAKIISVCLASQPSMRPTCENLLSNPAIASRMQQSEVANVKKPSLTNQLLQTIRVPRDFKNLPKILPKSNYKKKKEAHSLVLDNNVKIDDGLENLIKEKRLINNNRPKSNQRNGKKASPDAVEESIIISDNNFDLNNKKHPDNLQRNPESERKPPMPPIGSKDKGSIIKKYLGGIFHSKPKKGEGEVNSVNNSPDEKQRPSSVVRSGKRILSGVPKDAHRAGSMNDVELEADKYRSPVQPKDQNGNLINQLNMYHVEKNGVVLKKNYNAMEQYPQRNMRPFF